MVLAAGLGVAPGAAAGVPKSAIDILTGNLITLCTLTRNGT